MRAGYVKTITLVWSSSDRSVAFRMPHRFIHEQKLQSLTFMALPPIPTVGVCRTLLKINSFAYLGHLITRHRVLGGMKYGLATRIIQAWFGPRLQIAMNGFSLCFYTKL